MATPSLSPSLRALEDSQKRLNVLIQQLAKYSPGALSRVDLSSEIHDLLKEQSDRLELLRQDIEELRGSWVGGGSVIRPREEQEQELERQLSAFSRLEEDLKIAHRNFRRAQVDAKRAEDNARRREREELFSRRGKDGDRPVAAREGQKLTQDELAINAANDVTKSLRRSHALLESNLEQSQFAMQTLEESTQALAGLGEKYSGMEGLLKTSRGLLGQLYRSQKSDTWYLETAFYILLGTIAWLIFRRLLFGPGWWLLWMPLKLFWRLTVFLLSTMGLLSRNPQRQNAVHASMSQAMPDSRPTLDPGIMRSINIPVKGGGWGKPAGTTTSTEENLVNQIGKMVERVQENFAPGFDPEEDETLTEQSISPEPSNTKKRMMESELEPPVLRDEL